MDKPLSWSELDLFERDPAEHKRRYIDGIDSPATQAQELGSIIHKTIEDKKFPWLKTLVVANRPVKEQKIVRKILDKIEYKRPPESEVYMKAELKNIPLVAILDGLDRENRILDEFKTSSGNYWQERTVHQHGQLTYYALIYHLNFHAFFREIRLHRMNTRTGSVKTFYTARGPMDIKSIVYRIIACHNALVKQGLWDKRLTKEQRLKKSQTPLPI